MGWLGEVVPGWGGGKGWKRRYVKPFFWFGNKAELLSYFVCDCCRDLFRSMFIGFFFCCDLDRLFLFCLSELSFVVSLLIPSTFPFRPVFDRGRRREVERPRWVGAFCLFCCCDFFLFEAPFGPLVGMFFCGCVCSICSWNLLYLFSKSRYFLSRLSHSFLISSWSCSKLAPPSASSSIAIVPIVFPKMISFDSFLRAISLLFSSICDSKLADGMIMMYSTAFRNV